MADSDFNFIPPVEHFHNVPSLTAAKEREERKRRQRAQAGKQEAAKPEEQKEEGREKGDGESHSIDYCA
jgi:hypothetical protein